MVVVVFIAYCVNGSQDAVYKHTVKLVLVLSGEMLS